MSTPARKRLIRDFKRLQQDPPAGISGAPQDNNIMLLNVVTLGFLEVRKDGHFCQNLQQNGNFCQNKRLNKNISRIPFFLTLLRFLSIVIYVGCDCSCWHQNKVVECC
ncbi:uncharacterized protein LOC126612545 isoform X2 [Malus sylvestris]|nr:uncharacterized protein LOC126612545 isoform X2 [Malus sylvestris]